MKKIYVITHGLRYSGFNPVHTIEGLTQIGAIASKLAMSSLCPPMIMSGTGARFLEIRDALLEKGIEPSDIYYSHLFGGQNGLDVAEDGTRTIVIGEDVSVDYDDWHWPSTTAVNYWELLDELQDQTIICAGGELMISLGGDPVKGRLFEIDIDDRVITDITED